MGKLKKIIASTPLFLFLMPLFFAFHGFVEYYNFIPVSTVLITGVKYIVLELLLAFLFFTILRNILSASIISLLLVLFYLFFGIFYDFSKRLFGSSFLSSYTFLLIIVIAIITSFVILLIKVKSCRFHLASYFNLLFLILILLDLSNLLLNRSISEKKTVADLSKMTRVFPKREKPDIYLILVDEYAGALQLKNILSFNNSTFLNDLKKRGFSIQENSQSNYNKTPYSIASLLNMDYINNLSKIETQQDLFLCKSLTKKNTLTKILANNGYDIYNYSYFNIADKEKKFYYSLFFPDENIIYTEHTFLYRLYKNQSHRFPWLKKVIREESLNDIKINNNKLDSLTREIALQQSNSPRFIYSHFLMPHGPFFYDSTGMEINYDSIPAEGQANAYIQYLIYANKKILSLIDHILLSSRKKPVIVLMSDHGLRVLGKNQNLDYSFFTLNAVLLPNANYELFYKGTTNVNQFRIILNSLFEQKFPLLKDSTSYLTP
ncbi:hypothetical protein CAP36_13535 [Chitinophagaceae bacterium IBVUCB2]|nr:hypothetical protein CAP36_13535 [Chitinophagaceae bacterium IBVUCB2]